MKLAWTATTLSEALLPPDLKPQTRKTAGPAHPKSQSQQCQIKITMTYCKRIKASMTKPRKVEKNAFKSCKKSGTFPRSANLARHKPKVNLNVQKFLNKTHYQLFSACRPLYRSVLSSLSATTDTLTPISQLKRVTCRPRARPKERQSRLAKGVF